MQHLSYIVYVQSISKKKKSKTQRITVKVESDEPILFFFNEVSFCGIFEVLNVLRISKLIAN